MCFGIHTGGTANSSSRSFSELEIIHKKGISMVMEQRISTKWVSTRKAVFLPLPLRTAVVCIDFTSPQTLFFSLTFNWMMLATKMIRNRI